MPSLSISTMENYLKGNTRAKRVKGFGVPMRTGQRSTFEDGDILVFPKLTLEEGTLYAVFKKGNKNEKVEVVIEEPMMQDNAQVTRTNAQGIEEAVMLKYMILDAKRGQTDVTCRFFPSIFWKVRTEAIQENGVWIRGERKRSDGNVIDFVRKYGTVDEALVSLSEKKVRVNIHEFKSVPYGTARDASFEPDDDYVATLTFV